MGGIFFAAHGGKNKGFSTLIRTVTRGLQKNGYKKRHRKIELPQIVRTVQKSLHVGIIEF